MRMKFICVFCGSSEAGASKYADITDEIGKAIVANGYGLVYGGGNTGLMNMIANSVLKAGGEIIGVITPEIKKIGVVHSGIKKENLHEEVSYSARKARMIALSAGFIALPGGLGTLDELTEITIGNQFASYKDTSDNPVKPCVAVNADGFYEGLLQQLKRCVKDGMMTQKHLDMIFFTADPIKSVEHIAKFNGCIPDNHRWWETSKNNAEEKETNSAAKSTSTAVTTLWHKAITVKDSGTQTDASLSSIPKLS